MRKSSQMALAIGMIGLAAALTRDTPAAAGPTIKIPRGRVVDIPPADRPKPNRKFTDKRKAEAARRRGR